MLKYLYSLLTLSDYYRCKTDSKSSEKFELDVKKKVGEGDKARKGKKRERA